MPALNGWLHLRYQCVLFLEVHRKMSLHLYIVMAPKKGCSGVDVLLSLPAIIALLAVVPESFFWDFSL